MGRRRGISSRFTELPFKGDEFIDGTILAGEGSKKSCTMRYHSHTGVYRSSVGELGELNSTVQADIVGNMKRCSKTVHKQGRRGQALAEFIVCLVGLMFMFLGLMLIGVLGTKNVESFMESREMADRNSDGLFISTDGKYIVEWKDGADGLRHTSDDVAQSPTWSWGLDLFREQLITPAPTTAVIDQAHNEFEGLDNSGMPYLHLAETAELAKGTGRTSLDLEDLGLENAVKTLLLPGVGSTIHMTDETFMPNILLRGSDEAQ